MGRLVLLRSFAASGGEFAAIVRAGYDMVPFLAWRFLFPKIDTLLTPPSNSYPIQHPTSGYY